MLVKIYDGKTRMFPSKRVCTKEVFYDKYPAANQFTFCIVTDDADEMITQVESLNTLKARYNIPADTEDYAAVLQIQEAMNTPAEPVEEPVTADERIAAAMEFQNLMNL